MNPQQLQQFIAMRALSGPRRGVNVPTVVQGAAIGLAGVATGIAGILSIVEAPDELSGAATLADTIAASNKLRKAALWGGIAQSVAGGLAAIGGGAGCFAGASR